MHWAGGGVKPWASRQFIARATLTGAQALTPPDRREVLTGLTSAFLDCGIEAGEPAEEPQEPAGVPATAVGVSTPTLFLARGFDTANSD